MMVKSLVLPLMVIITMLAMSDASTLVKDICNVSNPPVVTDFDPQRFLGVWYLTHVLTKTDYLKNAEFVRFNVTGYNSADSTLQWTTTIFYARGCLQFKPTYKVKDGVVTYEYQNGATNKTYVSTALAINYTSTALFLYEIYSNGTKDDTATSIDLLMRNPQEEPDMSAVTASLRSFCGDNYNYSSRISFKSLKVNNTLTCD